MAETIYYDDKFSPVSVVIDTVYWVEPWALDTGAMYVKFKAGGAAWKYFVTKGVFKAFGGSPSAGSYYTRYIKNSFPASPIYDPVFVKYDDDEVKESRFDVVYTDSLDREVFFPTQATSEEDALLKASGAAGDFVNLNLKLVRVVHYFE